MRVTIAQINTTNGDYEGNTERIIRAIEQAKREKSDLVVFPEVCVQGYTSLDWFLDPDIARSALRPLERIIPVTEGITAIVGTVRPTGESNGRKLFNSAAVIRNRELLGFADKTLLPEYDVFDDPRYFEPARERRLFEIDGTPVGIAICEDFWNDKTFWRERLYDEDPTDELIRMGARLLVAINASPFNKGKMGIRCAMVTHRARLAHLPVVFVNLVGGNDGIIFDGASLVVDQHGETILQAPPFEEFIGTVDLDSGVRHERCLTGDDIETVHQALVLGIRDYARKNRFERVVIGISGGIDSAVVAALACEAVGPENVLGVMMPSPFSSRGSVEDARELGRRLGMETRLHPISEAFEVLVRELNLKRPTRGGESLAAENLQSRLRGCILMTISNAEGRLLLSTGNKSELALGYCTLYGDTNGGLAVLGDVLKTEVYALAHHINRERELIPRAIIEKRPSAELAPDQFDDQSLPPYDKLDPILKLYFEQRATPEEIIAAGNDARLVYDVLNRVESPANEFKRRQLPPTLIISRNAIGIGRRRPVTHRYRRVME
ncbi:NAD+ synthase [Pyrinomonas methylaliphatogenes]|uniref:Glutamine-dependent NAD(+) synthetase n=1 Tax=Pyrinomonas methylaliphatogenes TaxID=454194 RepID=A0A0B6WZ45_9BACT|nr:NAD+ synthase [Pyrinomonas methylaliphatogenes]CDM66528.1 NAD+ synthetase [Pyrinomonas methylaliphatogenes]